MNYKTIFNITKNNHWKSLFSQYQKIFIPFFAIPVLLFIVMFLKTYSISQQSNFNQSFVASASKSKSEIQLIMNNIDNYYNSLSTDTYIMDFLNSTNPVPDTIDKQEVIYNLRKSANSLKTKVSSVDSVFIYSAKSDYVFSTRGCNYRTSSYFQPLINDCLNRKSSSFLYDIMSDKDTCVSCISVVYNFKINNYDQSDGFLLVNIDCMRLSEFVSSSSLNEDALIYSPDGKLLHPVYTIQQELLSEYSKILISKKDEILSSDHYLQKNLNGMLCYMPIKDLGVIMTLRTSYKNQNNLVSSFIVTLVLIFIVILIFILAFSFYTSLVLYKSVANVISEVGIIPLPGEANASEVDFISNSFLSTLKNKSNIENELTKKINLLKKSQILALQTQINPHFIFNTLNLVNLMTIRIAEGNCPPSQILTLLSDIMYYSLQTDKVITTIAEELTYAEKYIQIEQIKYNNKFDFRFEVDESIKNFKIVKFTLQPILENCVEHGLKKLKDRKGMISLKCFKKDNVLNIIVSDNGNGIEPHKLEELNTRLIADDLPSGKHIGLSNVNQRIQLIFGKEYGVKILPLEQGVQINVTQPLYLFVDEQTSNHNHPQTD